MREGTVEHVFLCDIEGVEAGGYRANLCAQFEGISVVKVDVRREITWRPNLERESFFDCESGGNSHREPGHAPEEYYETNIEGAKHVTSFASDVHCDEVVFISSIAPYGAQRRKQSGRIQPQCQRHLMEFQAGGGIYSQALAASKPENRRLLIVRPGVVFGPTEKMEMCHGLLSWWLEASCFAGNQQTKAGIYVKEWHT